MNKKLFSILLMVGMLLLSTNTVKAQVQDEYYKGDYFYAKGETATITARTDNKDGAHVRLSSGKDYDLDPWVTIYGGSYDGVFQNTEIIMNGGTVAAIYGGGSGSSSRVTGTAKVTINGGTIGWTGKKIPAFQESDTEYGGFVYGGANSGGYVEKSEVVINTGTNKAIKHAVIASGNIGSETKSANIIVNNGSWLTVAHAIDTAKVGNAKITVNNAKTIFIFNGYYNAEGINQTNYKDKFGEAESFETELWNANYANIYTGAVKGSDGAKASSNTITKFSYKKGIGFRVMDFYNLGNIYQAKEVIPYITLNLHYGDNVSSKLVPQGKISKEVIEQLKSEISKKSKIAEGSILTLYLDNGFTKEYTLDTELATGENELSADLYLKVTEPTTNNNIVIDETTNPNTSDNLYLWGTLLMLGIVGCGYAYKKLEK